MHDDFIPSGRYHITMQNGMDGRRRELFPPRLLVYAIGFLVLMAFTGTIGFFVSVASIHNIRTELERTRAENEQLREKFEVYAALIDSLFVRQGLSSGLIPPAADIDKDILPYVGEANPKLIPFSQDPDFKAKIYETEQKLVYLARIYSIQSDVISNLDAVLPAETDNFDSVPSIYPTFGRISDGWGMRVSPFTGLWEFHQGIDIANEVGTPVYATAAGQVTEVGFEMGYGKFIKIGHYGGYETRYAHLYSAQVKVGEKVKKGQIVGLLGNSGMSTGPHLHYEVIFYGSRVNPGAYLNRIENELYVRR